MPLKGYPSGYEIFPIYYIIILLIVVLVNASVDFYSVFLLCINLTNSTIGIMNREAASTMSHC